MEAVVERQSEFLSPDEVCELTKAKPWKAQDAWLTEHGIPHRMDGRRVIVSRAHVRGWLEGRHVAQASGINWGAIK